MPSIWYGTGKDYLSWVVGLSRSSHRVFSPVDTDRFMSNDESVLAILWGGPTTSGGQPCDQEAAVQSPRGGWKLVISDTREVAISAM